MSNAPQKLPWRERICYGFGDLASCLFWATIMSQLLFFYTGIFGLTAKAAGLNITWENRWFLSWRNSVTSCSSA